MATQQQSSTGKTLAVAGAALALVGGLFAAFGGSKPRPGMAGALPQPPHIRKGDCNCGR